MDHRLPDQPLPDRRQGDRSPIFSQAMQHASHQTLQHGPVRTPEAAAEPVREGMVAEYLRTLGRHRKMIALCALAGLVLAILFGLRAQPVYRTRTSLDIKSLNPDYLDMRAVAPTGNGTADEAGTNLQTQIKLLQSDTLMQTVVDRMKAAPHAATVPKVDLLSRMERAVHVGGRTGIAYDALVENAAQNVKVKPLGLTRLVEITCDAWDAKFAAQFCNTLTDAFAHQDTDTRSVEAQKTQEWLTKQVADVRQRAEDSQRRLEAAVGGNGLVLSQTTTSAGEERLRALQDELVKAEADRMRKEASSDAAAGSNPDTVPDVQDNPEHRAYELKLADLRSKLALMVPTLTEQNPNVIKLRAQIADAEAGLRATASSTTGRQGNELKAARHREDLLQMAYNAQASTVSSDLQKAAQVSLLRKEVESEQQLYLTLLQRAKEAGFATALQAVTIRVIDTAKPPKIAASPRRTLTAGLGLALGALLGIGMAFYRERNAHVLRAPGEVSRLLHVRELGVIPAARLSGGVDIMASGSGLVHQKENRLYGPAVLQTRWEDSFSLGAEAYRNVTLSIMLADANRRTRSYVVTSPNVGEGKTTVLSNLGVALSKSKMRVVLVDGDLRRPNLHNAFAIENTFGLRNILRGEVDLEAMPIEVLTHRTAMKKVSVIPAGEGDDDVVELLHSPYLAELVGRLSREFDVILIDSPPTLHMADARILGGQTDGTILVFRAGKTTHAEASDARNLFEGDGSRLVGTILNDFDPAAEGRSDYYASYYRYGQGPGAKVGV